MAARLILEADRVRYLLGLSSPAEREHIESEYFENDDAFEEMLAAQNDLIDAYARGELTGEERQRFERSFVSTSRGRDRVNFAHALSTALPVTPPVETKFSDPLLDVSKIFRPRGLLQTATIAAVIAVVALLAWLVIDRARMNNEFHELRTESAELNKRTEEFQRSNDIERKRAADVAAQLADLRAQPVKPSHRERATTLTQQVRNVPEVKNNLERIAVSKSEQPEEVINTQDASLGNTFDRRTLTELPIQGRNVVGLLSLQPATTPNGAVAGVRTDQANMTLDGVDLLNTYSLSPRNTSSSAETLIRIPGSLTWIRFQIELETSATYEDYRITIITPDGRPVISVDWIEPVSPNQTIIDTPVVLTSELPSGDYVLLLMAQEVAGSFVKLGEYSFKLSKY